MTEYANRAKKDAELPELVERARRSHRAGHVLDDLVEKELHAANAESREILGSAVVMGMVIALARPVYASTMVKDLTNKNAEEILTDQRDGLMFTIDSNLPPWGDDTCGVDAGVNEAATLEIIRLVEELEAALGKKRR